MRGVWKPLLEPKFLLSLSRTSAISLPHIPAVLQFARMCSHQPFLTP